MNGDNRNTQKFVFDVSATLVILAFDLQEASQESEMVRAALSEVVDDVKITPHIS
jgi:hypothetical protein